MKIKLGYYPMLDMFLGLRQIYSAERFKPFNPVIEAIDSKLSQEERVFIIEIGDISRGWLNIIEAAIECTLVNVVSAEEFILKLYNSEIDIFKRCEASYDLVNFADKLSSLWQNYFNSEVAKSTKIVFEKSIEINKSMNDSGLKNYLTRITDRVVPLEDGNLKVLIKPEHIIEVDELQNIILMPSVFSCRNFSFWNKNNDYVFYISIDQAKEQQMEPSDMLLLKTSALSDKTRLKMLRIMSRSNFTTMDMAAMLNMNPSTVSRHFKLFKDAAFVDIYTQEGNFIFYSLNIEEIKKSFSMILNYIQGEE